MSDRSEHPPRAIYERIADALQKQIFDGTYPPGTRLPTIADLKEKYEVSAIVIRQAVARLKTQGLVETNRRAGTVVRERPPLRRVAMERYRGETSVGAVPVEPGQRSTSFTQDHKIAWSEYRLDTDFTRVLADEELAEWFDLPVGTELLRRHFVFYARNEPQQISINYMPWQIVGGTPVADPQREPWPGGTPAQCAFLGKPITRVQEAVSSRMPTPEETHTLKMPPGVPVITISRKMMSDTTVMEVCKDIILPADRVVLDYSMDL